METAPIQNERLKKITNEVTSIPTLPEVLFQVNSLLNDPDARATDLAKLISKDPALTFTLLKVVNSAYYGLPRKISQIDHAISVLGFSATYSLLMTTSVVHSFSENKKNVQGFSLSKFWTHSLAVATASRMIAIHLRLRGDAEDLYVSGLLHDVGKIIIQQNITADFQRILEKSNTEQKRMSDSEKEILGFTHAEVGELLATRWNLPPKLVAIIGSHHHPFNNPQYKQYSRLSCIVHLADILCKMVNLGNSGDPMIPHFSMEAWKELDIDLGTVDKILYQLREQKENIESLSSQMAH